MVQDWIIEVLKGMAKVFLQPLFYYSFLLAAFLGVSRVKRERKHFSVRAENAYYELKQLLPIGIAVGLGISIVSIAVGITVPKAFLIFLTLTTVLLSFTTKMRLLSPVYTIGLAFFLVVFAGGEGWSIPLFGEWFAELHLKVYPPIALLLALLLIGEGFLIILNGKKGSSPKIITSKRGLRVGIHEIKRAWMIPVFLFIPGSALEAPFSWWPVFSIGSETYSLLLVPFLLGHHQDVQGELPKDAAQTYGRRIIALGIPLAILAVGGYWEPLVSIISVVAAIVCREVLAIAQRIADENLPFYFSKRNSGLLILGIIPDSPASKMGLQVGELVTKVNGIQVLNERQFYEALQRNRAHCKLEVLDCFGRVRFAQRALYEGDHHELGILFVEDEKTWKMYDSK